MSDAWLLAQLQGSTGVITLNRPQALNALSLSMVRAFTAALLAWRDDDSVAAVVVRGASIPGRSVALCAGGDIRFFHQAALVGDPRLEDFFTEEYCLNQLIHRYPKPYVALMDGIVMGGGMGISQGAHLRVVTERSQLAMPETNIGLFPDVGGGYFLSRRPGRWGEYLALTGQALGPGEAMGCGLADMMVPSDRLSDLLAALVDQPLADDAHVQAAVARHAVPAPASRLEPHRDAIDLHFSAGDVAALMQSLASDSTPWAAETLAVLRKRSPLMLAVSLEQVRRARSMSPPGRPKGSYRSAEHEGIPVSPPGRPKGSYRNAQQEGAPMTLEDDLRMERNMIRHAFLPRQGAPSEAVEGIRALAVDKDHSPRWNPARIEDVSREMVNAFFTSPWPAHAHPLRRFY